MPKRWMIYGANGYTGELIAQLAKEEGDSPILAGRTREKVGPVGEDLGLETRVFAVNDVEATKGALEDIDAVVNAAGPFSVTSEPMVDACIATGTHYLDITGEIAAFEAIFKRHDEAAAAGVALIPGVGFDVIPTDCMAAMLFEALPDATHLELAFGGEGGVSRGTLRTAVEGIPYGGWIREGGKFKSVPSGWKTREIPFSRGPRDAVSIPWGDLSTAFRSTGIENIITYAAFSRSAIRWTRRMDKWRGILGSRPAQALLKKMIRMRPPGPDVETRTHGYCDVWGEVQNANGDRVSGTLTTPEAYRFTALGALAALRRVVEVEPGAWTPSKAFGSDFVQSISGVEVHDLAHTGRPAASMDGEA